MLDFIRASPLWLVLTAYALCALLVAILAANVARSWLRRLAKRTPSDLHDVLLGSLPRPIGAAVFLFVVDIGLRWLPMSPPLESLTRRLLPFSNGIVLVVALTRVGRKSIDAYGRSNPALRSSAGIGKAIMWVICLSAVALLASDALGISLAPALTALGVGSLAVALALQDTLSNFFSGIYLIVDKPVRVGEFVRLDSGQEGYVESIGWRATHIRTLAPSTVIVPNATLAKGVTTNYRNTNPRLSLELRVDVALEEDANRVEELLVEIAKSSVTIAGMRREPEPKVRFVPGATRRALGFTLYYAVDATADTILVQSELRKRVFARLLAAHVAHPSPAVLVSVAGAQVDP